MYDIGILDRPLLEFVLCCVVMAFFFAAFVVASFEDARENRFKFPMQSCDNPYKGMKVEEVVASMIQKSESLIVIHDFFEGGGGGKQKFMVKTGRLPIGPWDSSFASLQYEVEVRKAIEKACIERMILFTRLVGVWDLGKIFMSYMYETIHFSQPFSQTTEYAHRVYNNLRIYKKYTKDEEKMLRKAHIVKCHLSQEPCLRYGDGARKDLDAALSYEIGMQNCCPSKYRLSTDQLDACIIAYMKGAKEVYSDRHFFCRSFYRSPK